MADPDELRVGIVGGTRLPGNVATFLENVRELLAAHSTTFHCDLLLRSDLARPDGFRVVDPGISDTERAVETLRTLTTAVTTYASQTDVDVLFQVTKFPVHGLATTIAGWWTNTPVLARYAGDNFREYKFDKRGSTKAKTFILNNVLGRVPVRLADAIIVLGPYGHREITARNDSAIVYEIPQPVDTDRFNPVSDEKRAIIRKKLGISTNERMFLTVGRLTCRKGMDDIVRTARELSASNEQFTWYVIGDGPMRSTLSNEPSIVTPGRIPHDQLPAYYQAADLVVHPSRIEGLPNVLLEATACGTPSVSRDVGECSSVATVTYDEQEELAELLCTRYEPAALGDRFSEYTLRRAYADALVKTAQPIVEK